MSEYLGLQNLIGYKFADEALLRQALTHSSYGPSDNQRLEFLGDALLDFVVAELLYDAHPDWDEGHLTKTRAALVSRDPLSLLFDRWQLGNLLLCHNLSKQNVSVKLRSDIVEAIIGAIFCDGGMEPVKDFVERFIMGAKVLDDCKSKLLEWGAIHGREVRFETINVGDEHKQFFQSSLFVDGKLMAKGQGTSKKKAEQEASKEGLACIS